MLNRTYQDALRRILDEVRPPLPAGATYSITFSAREVEALLAMLCAAHAAGVEMDAGARAACARIRTASASVADAHLGPQSHHAAWVCRRIWEADQALSDVRAWGGVAVRGGTDAALWRVREIADIARDAFEAARHAEQGAA